MHVPILDHLRSVLQSAEVSEHTPRTLYLTAAILIREGFITLEDLYPHVSALKHSCSTWAQWFSAQSN